jgi:hypothetical protein
MWFDIHHSKKQMFQIKVVYEDYCLLGFNAVSSSKKFSNISGEPAESTLCACVFF